MGKMPKAWNSGGKTAAEPDLKLCAHFLLNVSPYLVDPQEAVRTKCHFQRQKASQREQLSAENWCRAPDLDEEDVPDWGSTAFPQNKSS